MKSIALAYLRWLVAPLVLAITFIAACSDEPGPPHLSETAKLTLAIMVCVWLAFVFLAGRTWGRAARQRHLLSACIGHGAPPELLFAGTLSLVIEDLERTWEKLAANEESHRSDRGATPSWKAVYPQDVSKRTLPIYYALCRYEAALSGDEVMTNRARLSWDRMERDWAKFAAPLSANVTRADRRPSQA
jgi:hypothetical protein